MTYRYFFFQVALYKRQSISKKLKFMLKKSSLYMHSFYGIWGNASTERHLKYLNVKINAPSR